MKFTQKLTLRILRIKDRLLNQLYQKVKSINHNGVEMHFFTPNSLCYYRAITFSTKEPETLSWIDSFPEGSVFWDIGANVGIYSIYAAKSRNCKVYSFEPSFFNLELLARNADLNRVDLNIFPIALNHEISVAKMNHTNTNWGGALSTFDKNYGSDGKILNKVFSYKTLGFTLDFIASRFNLPKPDFIKIDVDGIEHLILQGGEFSICSAREVLIEIHDHFDDQRNESEKILTNNGYRMVLKGEYAGENAKIANQIWSKS